MFKVVNAKSGKVVSTLPTPRLLWEYRESGKPQKCLVDEVTRVAYVADGTQPDSDYTTVRPFLVVVKEVEG